MCRRIRGVDLGIGGRLIFRVWTGISLKLCVQGFGNRFRQTFSGEQNDRVQVDRTIKSNLT